MEKTENKIQITISLSKELVEQLRRGATKKGMPLNAYLIYELSKIKDLQK